MIIWKSLAVGLDQDNWSDEQWLEFRYIFTAVPTGFADILIMFLKVRKSK